MEENRFRKIRDALGGISQSKLAESLGLPMHRLRDIEAGKVKMSPDIALALEEKFDFSFKWVMTGQGQMYKHRGPGGTTMIATGNGHVQVGGGVSGQLVQVRPNSEPVWIKQDHPLKDEIEEIFFLLKMYGSPKLIDEIKARLLKVKAAVEGE